MDVIAVLLLVVLIVPTGIWFAARARSKQKQAPPRAPGSGPKHRWWMP